MTQDAPLPVVGMSQYLGIAPRASHPYSALTASPRPPEPHAYVCDRSGAGHPTGVPLVHAEPGVVRCPECGARYVEPLDAAVLRLSVEVAALREASRAAKGPGFVAGGIAPDDRPRMMRVLAMACARAAGVTVDWVRTGISSEGDSFDRTDARRILARLCEEGLLADVSSGLEPSRYEVTKKGRAALNEHGGRVAKVADGAAVPPPPPALCANGCCFECRSCAAKPGTPTLCDDCVRRREACSAACKQPKSDPASSTPPSISYRFAWVDVAPRRGTSSLAILSTMPGDAQPRLLYADDECHVGTGEGHIADLARAAVETCRRYDVHEIHVDTHYADAFRHHVYLCCDNIRVIDHAAHALAVIGGHVAHSLHMPAAVWFALGWMRTVVQTSKEQGPESPSTSPDIDWAMRAIRRAQSAPDDAGILRPVMPGAVAHAGETVLACLCGWAGIAATLRVDGGCPSCTAGRPVAAGWVAEAQPDGVRVGVRVAPGVGFDVTAKAEVIHGRGAVVSAVNGGLPACGAGGPTTSDITAVTCDDPACLALAPMEAKALRALAGLSAAGETAEFIARTSHIEHDGLPLALLGLVSRRLATRTMRGTMSVYAITERGRRVLLTPPAG